MYNSKYLTRLFLRTCFIVLLLGIFSCSSNQNKKKVSDLATSELVFREMAIEPLLGRPYQIEVIDSILILADNIDGKALLLYDLSNSFYVRTLSVGQGPGEVLPPLTIDVSPINRTISILQRQTGRCQKYLINDLLDDSVQIFKCQELENADRITQMNEGYACLGMYKEGLLAFFNKRGEKEMVVDLYPQFRIPVSSDKYRLFQGRLAFNDLTGTLMFAPSYASMIKFYTYKNGDLLPIDSFSVGTGVFEERIMGNANYSLQKSDIRKTIDVCNTNAYFYVLYDGANLNHTENINHRYVIRFTANGNFDEAYKVNSTVCNICVSNDDSKMFALMIGKENEYVIGVSDLKE